jgi:hypothetical protein
LVSVNIPGPREILYSSKFSKRLTYSTDISYWPSGGGAFSNIYEPGKLSVAATDVGETPIPSRIHLQSQMDCKRAIYMCLVFPIFFTEKDANLAAAWCTQRELASGMLLGYRTAVWKFYKSFLYQGMTNYGRQVSVVAKVCTVAPISCGFSV